MSRVQADELLKASQDKPHEGRCYDYYLGGTQNWATDRAFADQMIKMLPDLPFAAKQNRAFLGRAVRLMLDAGIRQFIDLGSGLPTQGNVHELAEEYAPGKCRVVYVDHDPVASAHAFVLLDEGGYLDQHVPINGDVLDAAALWETILREELIDPSQPVGVLMVALLHFLPDDLEPHVAVELFREVVKPGSFLAISHITTDGMSDAQRDRLASVAKNYSRTTSQAVLRDRNEIRAFFGGWEVLDPGIVWTPEWRPAAEPALSGGLDPSRAQIVAGVARKP